jgi:hypothetical protein
MDPLLPVVLSCCCGIDVHKKSLTACLLRGGLGTYWGRFEVSV